MKISSKEQIFNSRQHYRQAVAYFNELAKQPKPWVPSSELKGDVMERLLITNPNLFLLLAMQQGMKDDYKVMMSQVQELTKAAMLSDEERPCLSTFEFIDKQTLYNILRRMVPDNSITQDEDDKNIITVLRLVPNLAVGIQTRDVNNFDEIERIADYIEKHKQQFDPGSRSEVVTHNHGSSPGAEFAQKRGQYIYVRMNMYMYLDWSLIKPLKLLDVLKPFMSDVLYKQSKVKIENVINKSDSESDISSEVENELRKLTM